MMKNDIPWLVGLVLFIGLIIIFVLKGIGMPTGKLQYEITRLDGSKEIVSYGICYMEAGTVTCKDEFPRNYYYTQALSLRQIQETP